MHHEVDGAHDAAREDAADGRARLPATLSRYSGSAPQWVIAGLRTERWAWSHEWIS